MTALSHGGNRRPSLDGKEILFTGNNPTKPGTGNDDGNMISDLENLGANITYIDDGTVTTADASGKDLVFVSGSVISSDIGTKFRSVSQPVLLNEMFLLDEMELTGASPTLSSVSESEVALLFLNPWWLFAASPWEFNVGFTEICVFVDDVDLVSDVKRLATRSGVSGEISAGYVDAGDTGDGGFSFPGRRIFYGAPLFESSADNQSAANREIFIAMCQWAMSIPMVGNG